MTQVTGTHNTLSHSTHCHSQHTVTQLTVTYNMTQHTDTYSMTQHTVTQHDTTHSHTQHTVTQGASPIVTEDPFYLPFTQGREELRGVLFRRLGKGDDMICFRPTPEFFTHLETSPLAAKDCKF